MVITCSAFAGSSVNRVFASTSNHFTCVRKTTPRFIACASKSKSASGNGVPPSGNEEYINSALASGGQIREQLAAAAKDRRETADRVQQSIIEMNEALDAILSKLRGDTVVVKKKKTAAPVVEAVEEEVITDDDGIEEDEDSDVDPYMDPNLFGMDSTAGWQAIANPEALPSSDAPVKFRIECDGSGCSIIEMDADAAPGPGVRQKFVSSGKGYRIGYDPEAPDSFCGMVGNEQWLLAMDKQETIHLKRLITGVARKMARIDRGDEEAPLEEKQMVRRSGDGMFNERIMNTTGAGCSVEMESKLMWVQAVGIPRLGGYALRVIFMERRQSEGYWAPDVVPQMLVAVAKLQVE